MLAALRFEGSVSLYEAPPPLSVLKWETIHFQASLFRFNSTYKADFCVPRLVDELFKEANVKSNGTVNYEEFTQMVTLPPVDYWSFSHDGEFI